jgi:hypothetical protein
VAPRTKGAYRDGPDVIINNKSRQINSNSAWIDGQFELDACGLCP